MNDEKNHPPKEKIPAIVQRDPYLGSWAQIIRSRMQRISEFEKQLTANTKGLREFATGHKNFGLHRTQDGWIFREWAPFATAIFLKGNFNGWTQQPEYSFKKADENGIWELKLAPHAVKHGDLYRLAMYWPGGQGERIPAWVTRVVQDPHSHIFNAQVWNPEQPYQWKQPEFRRPAQEAPLIYEAHIGMAQEDAKVSTFREFREKTLPRIIDAGYNTIQLMAIQEHPYYGSFGYHVSSFFAASSRFGTPEELKELIDAAHQAGIAVIMDLVHSHAVKNEVEGISRYDGSYYQFFHAGERGNHVAWDSRCFDYAKHEVLQFLLSNCRFWLEEYKFDGYRFDGVTSMLYRDHGLGKAFTSYDDYFGGNVDEDSVTYLALANKLIHEFNPNALTIAEDVSGMPGLAAPLADGGIGFDLRLAMGIPDYWIKLTKDQPDEQWQMGGIWRELTNRRQDERTVSYVESHDQAIVGDKTIMFRLVDKDMYYDMAKDRQNMNIDRGIALHKMIRLITLATAGGSYLNFIGNEFGHPEWIDFPRQGNNWSYHYARRQWSLRDNPFLKYHYLADFDKAMIDLAKRFKLLNAFSPRMLKEHHDDHVLCFERANLVFVFNFDPSRSYSDYPVDVPDGTYRQVFDSDSPEFGGFSRLKPDQVHISRHWKDADGKELPQYNYITLYLPNRSVQVLQKIR